MAIKVAATSIDMSKEMHFVYCKGSNAGDAYCCPRLYYDFGKFEVHDASSFNNVSSTRNSIIIFGGGGIIDTSITRNNFYKNIDKSNICFHWGSGSNRLNLSKVDWRVGRDEINIEEDRLEDCVLVGRRDWLDTYYENHVYVPCVSCKLSCLKNKYAVKRRIGIVQHMWLKQVRGLDYPTINMDLRLHSIEDIIKFIGESEVIIAGSFHAAYWGLLLQKKVVINSNWSSKFDTLRYETVNLSNNLENDISKCKKPPAAYLDECIELNDNFYKSVIESIEQRLRI